MAATNITPIGPSGQVMTVNTVNLAPAAPQSPQPEGQELDPQGAPEPRGIDLAQEREASREDSSDPATGAGMDGEIAVWEARYSKRNFIGRIAFRVVLTIAAGVLAYFTWGNGHDNSADNYSVLTWIAIGVVALLWGTLIFRMVQAHYSHYYRLTNRRLFVSTGVVNRRRDMMELLRVKDVFTRQQSLMERWLGLGTVVVVQPSENCRLYLAGVDDPKEVMDLIWHHARAERDHRSVKVDSV